MGVFGALLSSVLTEKVFHSSGMVPSMNEILLGQQEVNESISKSGIRYFINPSGCIP
jgi:hypothetical protein